jgi:ATP-binding cassette, subfamily A (ABC1), member 3
MEEADTLSVCIGILAKRMLAIGTSHQLRVQQGDAYHVHMVLDNAPLTTPAGIEGLRAWIAANLPEATEEGVAMNGQLRFALPKGSRRSQPDSIDAVDHVSHIPAPRLHMSEVLRLLEDNKQRLGLKFYSIGETTLDQVFLHIVHRHNVEEMEEEEAPKKFWRWTF